MESTSKGMIFYAEDDSLLREAVSGSLRRRFSDFDVETFEDGTYLDGRLKSGDLEGVRVVITDNEMPGVYGNDLIREHASKVNVPFVLFYGGNPEIGERAVEEGGADSYFLKPLQGAELFDYVEGILNQ